MCTAKTLTTWIYKSSRKDEMYLYLAAEAAFEDVPPPLLARFGEPVFVMRLELHARRTLAREDVATVIGNLRSRRFHLQMPPELKPDLYEGNED